MLSDGKTSVNSLSPAKNKVWCASGNSVTAIDADSLKIEVRKKISYQCPMTFLLRPPSKSTPANRTSSAKSSTSASACGSVSTAPRRSISITRKRANSSKPSASAISSEDFPPKVNETRSSTRQTQRPRSQTTLLASRRATARPDSKRALPPYRSRPCSPLAVASGSASRTATSSRYPSRVSAAFLSRPIAAA